jgi:hypothetical protein
VLSYYQTVLDCYYCCCESSSSGSGSGSSSACSGSVAVVVVMDNIANSTEFSYTSGVVIIAVVMLCVARIVADG